MTIGMKRNSLLLGIVNPPRRRETYIRSNVKILIAFLFGISLGRFGRPSSSTAKNCSGAPTTSSSSGSALSTTPPGSLKSSVQQLQDIPLRNTSHVDPKTGKAIRKQQFLEPFVVPNLAGFSVATIGVGETVEMHSHRSMHEFFYVLEGRATFYLQEANGHDRTGHLAGPGTFVHFVPHCVHGIVVADNSTATGDLKVLLAGVTVGD